MRYKTIDNECDVDEMVLKEQIPLSFKPDDTKTVSTKDLKVVSLFSGCGGMDLGFEGGFEVFKQTMNPKSPHIEKASDDHFVRLKPTRFQTVFANDILHEAYVAWSSYFKKYGYSNELFHQESIVDLVKMHRAGVSVFPEQVDVVTGGFPCQDFSVAGKRKGFDSYKDHNGKIITHEIVSEETRGKLYFWMKEVVEITKPKIFIAENVKGLTNFGDVKSIIQHDFSSAGKDGYIVLSPQVLHAANYGIPQTRERVIFIGIRKDALRKEALEALTQEEIPEKYNPYPKPTHAYTLKTKGLQPPVALKDIFSILEEPECSKDPSQKNFSKAKFMGIHCQGQKEINMNGVGPTIRSEHHGNIEFRRLSAEHGGVYLDELKKGLSERRLTPRECGMIQTFPMDYNFVIPSEKSRIRFLSSASGAYKVIGNAVPPLLAYHIAKRLESLWNLYFE